MFEKVLFPTDFSEVSRGILEWLVNLKGIVREVILVRVINLTKLVGVTAGFDIDQWIKHEEKVCEKKLSEMVTFLQKHDITARYITPIPSGDPVSEIVKSAEKERVSFIVMGSKGKGFFKEILVGSVSEGVVRRSKVPVMLVKSKCLRDKDTVKCEIRFRNPFERILFAYDLSEYSTKVLDYVREAALLGGKQVVIVNVIEDEITNESLLNAAATKLKKHGIDVEVVIRKGTPYKEIIKTAREEEASIIMIGSRGLGFIEGMLLGGTTDSVIRHSEIPIFVFKF
jgi:nucleotide-binding universal stress UspA family protein